MLRKVTVTNDSNSRHYMILTFHGRGKYIKCPYNFSPIRLSEHVKEVLPSIGDIKALDIAEEIRHLKPGDGVYELTYYERPQSLPSAVSNFTLEHLKTSVPHALYFAFAVVNKEDSIEVIHGSQEGRISRFDAERDADRLKKKNPKANIYRVEVPLRIDMSKADFNEVE